MTNRMVKPANVEEWERITGSKWVLDGVGHEILAIPVADLRRVAEIPADVTLVRAVPPPVNRQAPLYHEAWVPVPDYVHQPPPTVYLHITHRYCIRCLPGIPMCYGDLDRFLERYKDLTEVGR